MAFSAGVFSLLYNWNTDKINSIKVQANRMQAQEADIATGLSTAILKDGTQTITANIPFNSKLITGLGTASADDHALSRLAGDARYVRIAYAALADSSSAIAATTRMALITVALTAPRTYTLPAASALTAGEAIVVADVFGGVTATNNAQVARAGSDTINGGTANAMITAAYGSVTLISDGTSKWTVPQELAQVPRGYLSGLGTARASITTFGVSAGIARDSTDAANLVNGAAVTKSLSAWVAGTGNGALDTGAIAAGTWYYVYIIGTILGGLTDFLISLSATAPTMPSGYAYKRRIGAIRTNGSSQIVDYLQIGDKFLWAASTHDISTSGLSTTPALGSLTVPLGFNLEAILSGTVSHGTLITSFFIYTPGAVPSASGIQAKMSVANVATAFGAMNVTTNTSGQVLFAATNSSSSAEVDTLGWIDRRGRDD